MKITTFPKCCGAGVLEINHLTGKGEEADLAEIRKWVNCARRNGYRMYDFGGDYGGKVGQSSISNLNHPAIQTEWCEHNSWGMLLVITAPHQREIEGRLEKFGFKLLFETHNPVYGDIADAKRNKEYMHLIKLWGLDMNELSKDDLGDMPAKEQITFEEQHPRNPDGTFAVKAAVVGEDDEYYPDDED